MKICPNCHSQLPDGTNFCPRCGSPVPDMPNMQQQPPGWSPAQQPQTWTHPQQEKKRTNVILITVIAVACVVICGILLFVFVSSSKDDNAENTELINDSLNTDFNSSVPASLDEHQYDWLSERAVTAADLSGKTAGDLRLLRNAIFARHGYKFKSADLQEYFANFSWYTPKYSDVNAMLSPIEKQNIAFIQKFEGGGSGGSSAKSGSKGPRLQNIGFTNDYSDYACYTWLDDSDVRGLSRAELRILRNTIYARHGRKFKSADLRNYFSRFSWYSPRYDEISESSLSETEKHNIMLIKRYE